MSARWLLGRVTHLLVVLLLVAMGTFLLLNVLPGDPAATVLGPSYTPANAAIVRSDLGLDDPLPVRFGKWLERAAQGDLGVSYRTNEVVSSAVRTSLWSSLQLLVLAQVIALAFAVPAGLWAGHRVNRRFDRVASSTAFGFVAFPQFVLGIVLLTVFAVKLHWLPSTSPNASFGADPLGHLRALLLPALALGLPVGGLYLRILRTDVALVLAQDHIQLARAMGLPTRRILLHHALRQSSLTLLTVVGLNVGGLLGGAVLVERIFSVPGIGRRLVEAITTRDVVMAQGCVLVIAIVYVVANFAVDVTHGLLDPRIRHERATA